ncbi:uncharacterized protein [Pyrus communis]|uniref:uncharacterized protein n=1 Tax=Pyrus communis TaxID=23211 RepID=UPI0035BF673E
MDKSWLTIPRNFEAYTTGINLFLDQAVANGVGPDKFRCPCKRCCNRYTFVRNTIVEHLILYDMDKDYKNACWRHHGEQNIGEQNVGIGEEETGDEVIGMHDFLNDVFVQPLTEEGVGPSTEPRIGEGRPEEVQTFFKLLEEEDQDLWPGCKEFKKLEAVVRLYQIKCLVGMPDEIFTTLLELIKRMLPEGDCLPESCYKAKKLINDLGLSYVKIDACPNDCMIYWKDTSYLTVCSVCGKSRYKITNAEDSSRKKVAAKVMWYFPLKPRLQRFFMSKHMAEHMRWHATECPKDEFMRHPSDSPAWKHLDNLYPDFASEIRNVRLGLASDGFNPFGKIRNDHSTWPVVLSVYNLPPWMCMKQPNLLLSLLIPGPRSPGKEIDVYMHPLIDELNELWEVGIPTYDAYSNQSFTMKAAVLWTISDFPAYGMLSRWSTHGYKACPHYMHDKESIYLPESRKICYMGHRRFLEDNHRFRRQTITFNGRREHRSAPRQWTGLQCLEELSTLRFTFGKPNKDASVGQRRRRASSSTSSNSQWKKKSIFYELPYWRHLLIRHNLDVMHIEKNICDSVVGTLLDIEKSKDGLAARADLEFLNIRHSQHPRREGNRTFRPPALFTLKREEKTAFCKVLSTIRVPDGYSSNLSRCVHVNERKIHGLKSHDCHVLMQQLLPLAIRPVLSKAVTMVLLELSVIFKQLCSKKESEEGFKQLNSRIALTLCQLEKIFPPAFFDIMVHLPVHLADEAALAGPVQYRWMYPIEQYLQTLKRYVRNKGRPEGSIAEAYLVDECLSFCSMYLTDVESRRTRKGRNEDGIGRGVSGENVELDLNVLDQCHRYILNNCDKVSPFRRQHEEFLKTKHRRERLTMRQIKELSKKEFPEWFKQHMNSRYDANDTLISQDLHWLANYPSRVVSRYKSHIVHGFRFRIKSVDDKHKNQNCGVFVPANVPGAIGQVNCYGRVVDMFEVKYCGPTEAGDRGRAVMLFKCEWVNSESPRGMKTDQYGFTMVNFNQLGFKEDPFILASQALQAFYVEDTIEKDWHVVVRTQPRDLFDVLEDSDAIDDYAMPNLDDRILDNENFHTRVGVEETPFLESLALPTGFVNHANTDDELTDDDRE